MQPFVYERASAIDDVLARLGSDPQTTVIAGGTELVNWLKEGIATPQRVVDINRLPGLDQIVDDAAGLHLGALARMSDVAAHDAVRTRYPAVAEALDASASQQLRNMASMGGNLLQRTRCPYFRADAPLPCNKRSPGSGCSALLGSDRAAAIFGASDACIATHPSDVAVALAALDALVEVTGPGGRRVLSLDEFYRLPGDRPEHETTLAHDELIVGIHVPDSPAARSSHYLKIRERASYEFALVSAAVAVALDGIAVAEARIALGGVAPKPWRLRAAEESLRGAPFTLVSVRAALTRAFDDARTGRENGFKIELAKRTVERAMRGIGAAA
jgi:xanthine dehydrogenase YagS FAD-binding subunit